MIGYQIPLPLSSSLTLDTRNDDGTMIRGETHRDRNMIRLSISGQEVLVWLDQCYINCDSALQNVCHLT